MAANRQLIRILGAAAALAASALIGAAQLGAAEKVKAVVRDYSLVRAAPAPRTQDWDEAEPKSAGCQSCHTDSDAHTMHRTPAVVLGCTDCHGGNPPVRGDPALAADDPAYVAARDNAHVLPRYPDNWHFPSAPIRGAATPCSTSKRPSSSASSTRPTIASRARPAAPAISRSSRRPSAR